MEVRRQPEVPARARLIEQEAELALGPHHVDAAGQPLARRRLLLGRGGGARLAQEVIDALVLTRRAVTTRPL